MDRLFMMTISVPGRCWKIPLSSEFIQVTGISQPASVKKALNRLIQLKIIYRYQKEYKFINPFFKSWLIYKDF